MNLAAPTESQSQLDRKDAIEARRLAIAERDHSRQLSAGLALEKGIALGEEGQADRGLLWMLEALKTAPEMRRDSGKRFAGTWVPGSGRSISHSGSVESIGPCTHLGFSPDGRTFATGFNPRDRDRATPIVLWDTASGRSSRLSPVLSLRSPSGRTARSCSPSRSRAECWPSNSRRSGCSGERRLYPESYPSAST